MRSLSASETPIKRLKKSGLYFPPGDALWLTPVRLTQCIGDSVDGFVERSARFQFVLPNANHTHASTAQFSVDRSSSQYIAVDLRPPILPITAR
jgi:hypothetical protein